MTTQAQTEIQNRFIKGLTWKILLSVILATVSITSSVVVGFQSLRSEIKDTKVEFKQEMRSLRSEVRATMDTIKFKQMLNKVEIDGKIQLMNNKLDNIQNNTDKK